MSDTHPERLATALELLRNTARRAHTMKVDRYEVDRQADADMHRLTRFGGKLATDHYMRGDGLNFDTLNEGAKLLVTAGMRLGWAAMLRNGVETHLKTDLQHANTALGELLEGIRIEARPVEGIQARQVIGLHTPTGTMAYKTPESGVEGIFERVDSEWGRIYLRADEPGNSWQIEPFDTHHGFTQRVILDTLPLTRG